MIPLKYSGMFKNILRDLVYPEKAPSVLKVCAYPVRKTFGYSVLFCWQSKISISAIFLSMAVIWRHNNNVRNVLEISHLPLCFLLHLEIHHSEPGKSRWNSSLPFPAPQGSCCRTQNVRNWGTRTVRPFWQCRVLTRRMRGSTPSVSPRWMDTRSRPLMCLLEVSTEPTDLLS